MCPNFADCLHPHVILQFLCFIVLQAASECFSPLQNALQCSGLLWFALESLETLENMKNLEGLNDLEALEHLENLNNLKHLRNLEDYLGNNFGGLFLG